MSVFRRIIESEQHEDETELWMLPYSTFMLMLVILFIVFYAMSSFNSLEYETALADLASTKPGSLSAERARKEVELARKMKESVKAGQLSDVTITAQYIKLKMESPALFDSGSADLKSDGAGLLEKMLENLKQMDNLIIVEGHTDNVPIHGGQFNSNWELSSARAFSVIRFFIGKNIEPPRLVAHGFGEFRPLLSNDTEQGRAKNRRIEITIVRGEKKK
ncbi:MAG: OmpA family protein [Nitrospirae bacterium]|nr:OmpA family protein [Nitrospirota bacterium]